MTEKIKINKFDLIESIKIHYLKQGLLCQNLNKMSKEELVDYINENNIEYVDKDELKKEIINIETYNNLRDVIYCNFIKYENIPYEIISNITKNTSNEELETIINKYNLKSEDNFKNTKELIFNIYKSYKKYCENSKIPNQCTYITLPSIINALKKIN